MDSQPLARPGPGLRQVEHVDGSVTETSPEQRGSEVHTKKTVMIKTIETRDGEVSHLPGLLTLGGGHGVCLGGCQPGAFLLLGLFEPLPAGRGGPASCGSVLPLTMDGTELLFLPRSSVRPHSSNTRCSNAGDLSATRDRPCPCPHCLLKPASFHPKAPHPATVLPSQPLTPAHQLPYGPHRGHSSSLPSTGSPQQHESWMLELNEPGSWPPLRGAGKGLDGAKA